MARFDLSDKEWAIIAPLLPVDGRGPKRLDDRTVLNGIFYILRTGAPWRDLPGRCGPPTTVYNRYVRWGERGIWREIFEALASEHKDALVFIDSSIVKAHRAAVGSKKANWQRVLDAHAAADHLIRKVRKKLSQCGPDFRNQILGQLSPDPSCHSCAPPLTAKLWAVHSLKT
jgi:transposase